VWGGGGGSLQVSQNSLNSKKGPEQDREIEKASLARLSVSGEWGEGGWFSVFSFSLLTGPRDPSPWSIRAVLKSLHSFCRGPVPSSRRPCPDSSYHHNITSGRQALPESSAKKATKKRKKIRGPSEELGTD